MKYLNKISYKCILLIVIAVLAILFVQPSRGGFPEMIEVPDTNSTVLQESLPAVSRQEAKDISHQIQRATDIRAPEHQYYTRTQEAADAQAKEYAKKEKVDKVIKQTTKEPFKDDSSTEIIDNKYYAINLERKHRIDVGAAVIDSSTFATMTYRNRNVACTAMYNPVTGKSGAMVSTTVAKW